MKIFKRSFLIFILVLNSYGADPKSIQDLLIIISPDSDKKAPSLGDHFLDSRQGQQEDLLKKYLTDSSSGEWNIDSSIIKGRNGGRGPGGGDGLFCGESKSHQYSGWYSYDFIQSRKNLIRPFEDEFGFSKSETCNDYMKAIQQRLQVVNPLLAVGLEHFIDASPFGRQESTFGIKREWRPIELGEGGDRACLLFNVEDETENITLDNCQRCQLFIRKYSQVESKIFYLYHKAQLDFLIQKPRQCSYAVIHEWGRDFLPNSQDLYDFVAYLHSKEFFRNDTFKYVGLTDDPKKRMFAEQGKALKSTSLDLYFKMVSQVPAAPGEVKEFQENFLKQFQSVVEQIEEDLIILERVSKKDPSLPNNLHITGKEWLEDIRRRVRNKEITLGKAFQELIDLQSSIPIMKGVPDPLANPFFRRMMFEPVHSSELNNPWNKFQKDDD